MICRWRTCSSAGLLSAFCSRAVRAPRRHSLGAALLALSATPFLLPAGQVTGRIELVDSRNPAVRRHRDYSGVVVILRSSNGPQPGVPPPKKSAIVQKDKTFLPHVLAVPVGSTVDFPNADPIFHNAFSSYNGQIFDVGLYPPGTSRSVRFSREGVVRVFCNIHPSMSAMIVVLATPYYATTREDGSFEIAGVPQGDYGLSFIHERATEQALAAAGRHVRVDAEGLTLSEIMISEAGFLSTPHKNKYGQDYAPEPPSQSAYQEMRH